MPTALLPCCLLHDLTNPSCGVIALKVVLVRTTGGPEVLEVCEAPVPEPRDTEVLIAAEAFGVGQPDALIRKGIYKWMPPLPANPGNDLAGRIAGVGGAVSGFAVGQKVLLSARDLAQRGGCYAEYVAVPADAVHALPESVDLEQAAALSNYQVAYALLHETTGPRAPKSVLVIGAAGGVGSALVDLAKNAGMTVIGTVSGKRRPTSHGRWGPTTSSTTGSRRCRRRSWS